MKNLVKTTVSRLSLVWIMALVGAFVSKSLAAQNARVDKTKMKALAHWVGEWEGEGWQMDQSRQRIEFTVEEVVESKLDGTAIFVEGKGKSSTTDFLGHHAVGLIYYNLDAKTYEFKSITQEGMMTLAKAKIDESGDFIWGFEVPGGQVRFTLAISETTWNEKGHFSMDGQNWFPIMEMNLTKKKP